VSALPAAIDQVLAAAIAWREADENDDEPERERLTDAVDMYRHAVEETGMRG
jgi:hypothetical protein